MFIGREKELDSLNRVYNQPGFGMTVIYGRRRIGKSTLITEFVCDKDTVFYTATKVGAARNLELFSQQIRMALTPDLPDISFPNPESVFDYLSIQLNSRAESASASKLVLVIDELPYWASRDESLLSILQKYIDTKWLNMELMIILCGSTLSFMEEKVLSEKSPLFGRRSSQIRLDAFSYLESALFVPNFTNEEKALCYGITGGVAKYLSLIDPCCSIDDNIKRLFFHPDGYLYDETRNLLTQEFTDVTLVNNVIEQIASGHNTVNQIAQNIHESAPKALYTIDRLIEIDLVEKRHCITEEKNRKKTQYILKDQMFRFWYQFIPKAISVIELGHGDLYYEKAVKPNLHSFMGSVFEEMCRRYTLDKGVQNSFGSFLTQVGMWWGTETIRSSANERIQQSVDIDIVALSEIDKTVVIGECKFKKERIDRNVYETLLQRGSLINGKYHILKYLLFSLSGYTEWFDNFDDPNTLLLTLDDLYS